MPPKLWLIPILSLSLIVLCCAPAGEQAATLDEDAIALEVKQASDARAAALMAGDVDTFLSYYMDDAVWLPPEAEEIVGTEVARARLTGVLEALSIDGGSQIEEQIVMTPEWVTIRGQFNRVLTPKGEGGETVYQVGSFVNIWKKDADGKWKIVIDIWNSDRGVTAVEQVTGKK